MITINLLPQEYRQKRRPALQAMAVVSAVVAVNASLAGWWAWTSFGVAAEVASDLALLDDTMTTLRPQIAYHEALERESKLFQARERTLEELTGTRVSWTRKVDELVDVIDRGGDRADKYLVWLDDLTVDQEVNTRRDSYGSTAARGNSGSKDFKHVADFLDDIARSPFSEGFGAPAHPEGSQSSVDPELIPSEVWSFPLELKLKAPEERSSR